MMTSTVNPEEDDDEGSENSSIKKTSLEIVHDTEKLITEYKELLTIQAIQYGTQGVAASVIGVTCLSIAAIILIFIGFGGAWWLGEWLHDMKTGFFIVGGVFILLLTLFILSAKKFIQPFIRNLIIKKIYE